MVETAVSVNQLATILGVHPKTIYVKARAGDIPGVRVGRAWRFYPSQVHKALSAAPADPWVRKSRR